MEDDGSLWSNTPPPIPFFSLLVLLLKDRFSLYSPSWPGIHVDLASLPSHALDLSEDKRSPLCLLSCTPIPRPFTEHS